MMKRSLLLLTAIAWMTMTIHAANKYPYKDATLPIEQRVEDLLSRMTLEEKAGQLVCLMGWDSYQINGKRVNVSEKFIEEQNDLYAGMYWAVFRADPWTRKTLANGLNPALAAQAANAMQRYAIEQTRLGIPLFIAEEAPHGHMAIGATVFPTGLGMAATWSTDLMQLAGSVIGKEIRLQGGHISYGPVLDLSREPRWSRVEETLGEDPYLSGEMGAAMATGLGGWWQFEYALLDHRHIKAFHRLWNDRRRPERSTFHRWTQGTETTVSSTLQASHRCRSLIGNDLL